MALSQIPLSPYLIDFDPGKLDEVRIAVIEGFYAVPHGGIEIGGLLYGTRENGRIRILDYRKIETEYLTGPSFHLSPNDLTGLRRLLAEPAPVAPEGELEVLGWYHSHTRSGIHLSGKDLEVFEEFFPKAWQISMVLRPENMGPVQAGYFFRDERGNVAAATSAHTFALQPLFGEKSKPKTPMKPLEEKTTMPLRSKLPRNGNAAAASSAASPIRSDSPSQEFVPAPRMYISEPMRWFGLQPWVFGLVLMILFAAAGSGYWVALYR